MNETPETPAPDADPGRAELLKQAAPPPKKKRRILLKLAIAAPVLLALLVLLGPTLASTGPVRRRIESEAQAATGRRVTLEDHSLGWWAPATLENFVMYEKDGTTPFLKIGKISVKVDIGPLLDSNVVLRNFEMSGVEVRIVRRKDGTLSTDDIGPAEKAQGEKPAPSGEGGGAGGTFAMGTVTIRDVAVTFVDEAAGSTYRVTGLAVTAKPGATPDEIAAEVAGKIQAGNAPPGELNVKANVLALSGGRPRKEIAADATVELKGLDAAAMMPMEGVDWATGAVGGTVKAKLLPSGDVDASVDLRVPFFRWGDPGAAPAVATPVSVAQDVSWRKSDGRIELKPGGRVQMNGCDVQAQGSLAADGPVDLLVKFDAEMAKLREVLPGSLADQDVRGPLRTNWVVKGPSLDVLDLQGTATLTSTQLPTDYTYATTAEDGKKTYFRVPNPGNLTVRVKGSYDGVRRKTRAEKEPGREWASLDGIVMDVTVESPWIISDAVDLKQLVIDIGVREQACDLRHLDFRINDGEVKCAGSATLDSKEPAWTFRTTAGDKPVKYSYFFSSIASLVNPALYSEQKGQVEAAMAWDVALKGKGFDMDALRRSLEGEGSLGLRNITLAGSPLFNELYSKLQLTKQSTFSYSLMDQKFRISAGKILNDFSKWQGEGKEADITISGETDFDGNMKQKITVSGDPTARWGKTTGTVVDVFNKAGGLPLGGTVSDPKIDIDFEKALKGALENPDVKEKVDDLLDIFKKKKKK